MSDLLKQINLLYIEDDENIRPVFEKVLARKVKKLYTAVDGLDGYEKYLKHKPDIILTDIKMPKLNGIEMSRKIKDLDSDIPIIAISAHSESSYLLESIELGIDAYLLKPIDRKKLLSVLESNAKVVLFEREKDKHQRLLEAIIDLQPSIIFSADKNRETIFSNRLFFDFFACTIDNDSPCDLSCEYEEINQNPIVEILGKNSNEFWLDYLFSHENKSFRINITRCNKTSVFLVKSKLIKAPYNGEKVIVVTLFEE